MVQMSLSATSVSSDFRERICVRAGVCPCVDYTVWYSKSGSPTFSISGIVHFRSKAFDSTILKICDMSQYLYSCLTLADMGQMGDIPSEH